MRKRKRVVLILAGLMSLSMAAIAAAMPEATTCLLMEYQGLERLPNGEMVERGLSETQRQEALELHRRAASRVGEFYGSAQARPLLVFLERPERLWPSKLNSFGSTLFVGTRACVVVGPKGRNVDVVAHELMHAELFERVGAWQRQMAIPVWFDEGLAMQADYRPKYARPTAADGEKVRMLDSAAKFFVRDDAELTEHYAMAKAEVAKWLARIGRPSLARRLDGIRNGEEFERAWNE